MYSALGPRLRTDAAQEQMFCLTSHGLWLNLHHPKEGRQRSTESTVGFDVREGIQSIAPHHQHAQSPLFLQAEQCWTSLVDDDRPKEITTPRKGCCNDI